MSRLFVSTRSLLFTLALAASAASLAACGSDADDGLDGPSGPDTGAGGDDVVAGTGGANAKGGSSSKGGSSNKGGSSAKGGSGGSGEGGSGEEGGNGGNGGDGGDGGDAGDGGTGGAGGKSGAGGSAGTGGKAGAGGSGGKSGAGGGAGKSGAGGSAGTGGKAGASGSAGGKAGTGGSAGKGGGGGTGGSGGAIAREKCASGESGVRIMAANLTSGNNQKYESPGIQIMQAVKPDVILIQEFTPASGTVENLVAQICGADCTFQRGSVANGGTIPNGVISRYPILAMGTWIDTPTQNRQFEWARIDVPGPRDLLAISVHLLTKDESRPPQTAALVNYIQTNAQPTDYVVLGGDFNTSSYDDPAFATLAAVLDTAAPYPADQTGNTGTNTNRLMEGKGKPYDHVVANASLRAHETAVVIGGSSFAAGAVIDTRVYNPITDLAPAQVGDSGAVNMQHMGVVRAYCVPDK